MDGTLAIKTQLDTVTKTKAAKGKTKGTATKSTSAKRKKNPNAQGKEPGASCQRTTTATGKNQRLGKLGEDLACVYLKDNSFDILKRNWKCFAGEADVIALEDDTLVFIEIKTRSLSYKGLPEYAVTAERRDRYERIALCYLEQNQRPSGRVRFDVIAIKMTGESQCLLRHHRDAFGAGE
ncbi:MAG: YraN family protein [Coriobacteriia bacterium]|nr:YraN family protein [Coriobacteriia bacterium]